MTLTPIVVGLKGTTITDMATLDVILSAITENATSYSMYSTPGRENFGHGGFCACPEGHSNTPTTWVEYSDPSHFWGTSFYVHYCDAE